MIENILARRGRKLEEKALAPADPFIGTVGERNVYVSPDLPDYALGLQPEPATPDGLPNYDKLSRTERYLMDKLAGIPKSVSIALAKFNEGPFGKVLGFLDLGAEAIERTVGFGTQWAATFGNPEQRQEFQESISAAWYAGSLAADLANSPMFQEMPDGTTRFRYGTDLAGLDGVIEARRQIAQLMLQGMPGKQALELVRGQIYDSAGALAFRMAKQDAIFHIGADPLNVLLAYIKPIEKLKVASISRIASKAIPEEKVKLLSGLDDVIKATRNADEIKRLTAAKTFLEGMEELTPLQQRLARIMNVASEPPNSRFGKFLQSRWNPFGLTPEARAHILGQNVVDNVLSRVVGKLDDPAEIMRTIQRIADGTAGPEVGHMLASVEGRMVRAVVQDMTAEAQAIFRAYTATANERRTLNIIGDVIGENADDVFAQIKNGESAAILGRFGDRVDAEVAVQMDELLKGVGWTGLTNDTMEGIVKTFGDTPMLHPDHYKMLLIDRLAESTARLGIARYGVKANGFMKKMADMVKSAETLGFLRLNPGYLARNFVNNEFTMLARGAWMWSKEAGESFWKQFNFQPTRLKVGFGYAGPIPTAVGEGSLKSLDRLLVQTTRGKSGWIERVTDWFNGRNLGKFDMGTRAAAVEQNASVRAFTAGAMRYNAQYRQPLRIDVDEFARLTAELGPSDAKGLERALADLTTDGAIDDLISGGEVAQMSARSIATDASRRVSADVYDVIPAEEADVAIKQLTEAFEQGGATQAQDTAEVIRKQMEKRFLDSVAEEVTQVRGEVAARVSAEGPGALPELMGDMFDSFWGTAHEKNALDNARFFDDFGELRKTEPAIARAVIEQKRALDAQFWDNEWGRVTNTIDGIVDGFKDIERTTGQAFPFIDEVKGATRGWRDEWKKFFTKRNKLQKTFWDARSAGTTPPKEWDEVVALTDGAYQTAMTAEDTFLTRIDDVVANLMPEQQQPMFRAWREGVNTARIADREVVQEFFRNPLGNGVGIYDLPADLRQEAFNLLSEKRVQNWRKIVQLEKDGLAGMMGEPTLQGRLAEAASGRIARMEEEHLQLTRQLEALGPEGAEEELQALREAIAAIDDELRPVAPEAAQFDVQTVPDFHEIVPRVMREGEGFERLFTKRGDDMVDALRDSTIEAGGKRPIRFAELSDEAQGQLRQYVSKAKTHLADENYKMTKFGEWMRDSALLNYNRRYNYNTFLGMLAPYEFWTTQSIFKWALHSLDRPQMAATYFRLQKFLDTAYRPETGIPSRLQGQIRIKAPFLPDYLGDELFVDPMRLALPFKNWAYWYEQLQGQRASDLYSTERVLEELLNDGEIDQFAYDAALENKEGPVWERATALARMDDTEGRRNTWDFASMLFAPHAPIVWAVNAARGTPEEIQPFLPLTRSIRGVTALLGIGPAGGVNVEGALRRSLGLPPFDRWDPYRVDRMLSNMVADGLITVDTEQRAMIERENSQDPNIAQAFAEAKRRAGVEYGIGSMGSVTGLPVKAYPPGEEHLRELRNDYEYAWERYEGGDSQALDRFYKNHPEYEARLGLFDTPEERVRKFAVDHIWDIWNDMPTIHKQEVSSQLGDLFQNALLNKDTRSYESIPVEYLQTWLELMGGDTPGQVEFTETLTPLQLTDPSVARDLEVFYETRRNTFRYNEQVWPLQKEYFSLKKGDARRSFLREHPILKQYWDWRRDFMYRNPSLAPYIEDDPDKQPKFGSEALLEQALAGEPAFLPEELQAAIGLPITRLLQDEEPLPEAVKEALEAFGFEVEE